MTLDPMGSALGDPAAMKHVFEERRKNTALVVEGFFGFNRRRRLLASNFPRRRN